MRIIKIKSPLNFALALLLVASFVTSTFNTFTAHAVSALTASPRVSFTFDDGLNSALTNAAPVLAAHGLTGTDYIITNCVGMTTPPNACAANGDASYMTWDQIAQLKAFGWEIASHTKTHPQLALADGTADGSLPGGAAQVTDELVGSQQTLQSHGYDATDLAFPYGDYDNNALIQAAKYYESARGFADLGYNTWPYNNSLVVNQQVQGAVSVATVKGYVDQAIANNQWLVLTFHDIQPNASTATEDYQWSNANLDAVAAYVQTKQTAGQIKSVNVTDGLTKGTNLLPNGNFANGIADGWTTDDTANITANAGNNGRFPQPLNSISLKSNTGVNPGSRDGESHLFSPKVGVTFGKSYLLRNYVNMVSGGSVSFYIDEYDASGNWVSGVDPNTSRTFSTAANPINVADTNFIYTPTSATVASASLQVIVRHATSVQAYLDESQWFDTSEVSAPTDTTAPVISNVATSAVTGVSATATWTTDELSTSQVEYGLTTAYGSTASLGTIMATTHGVTLPGLTANTTYHYRVISKDAAGNTATSGDFTFTTTGSTPTPKIGDIDGNGVVNDDDATIMFANWGPAAGGSTTAPGDINHNGIVDDDDATILFANWSK